MAKKKSSSGLLGNIAAFAAFIGVFFAGIGWMISFVNSGIGGAFISIGMFSVLVSVSINGWIYVNKTNLPGPDMVWTVLFIVFVVLAFFGVIAV